MRCLKVPSVLKSVKLTLATVNGVFLITGVLLLSVGLAIFFINSEYETLITSRFFTLPQFLIATGAIIFLVSVLGFYAAISEQFYFIAAYVVLLIVILVFEMSMVIVGFGLRDDTAAAIRDTMVSSWNEYETKTEVAKVWDEMQREFECCGVVSRTEWIYSRIPISCCHIDYGQMSPFNCTIDMAYTTGCAVALGEWLSDKVHVIAVTALVITCVQVLLVAVSGFMAWRSKYGEVELES